MRAQIALVLVALVSAAAAAAPEATPSPAPARMTDAKRDELRNKAEALRERNARERDEIQKNFRPADAPVPLLGSSASVTQAQVCKATVAALMGRDPGIVNIDSESGGVTFLSYRRPSDGSNWANRCKLAGQSVMWATKDGRWRDHPQDEKVSFKHKDGNLIIRVGYADGSANETSYPISGL